MLVLEHYGWGESEGLSPRPGVAGMIAREKARSGLDSPRVVNLDTGQRLQPITDYRIATRSFNRGVRLRFVLESGTTYEVFAHTSWKGREVYRCQVSASGEVIRLER